MSLQDKGGAEFPYRREDVFNALVVGVDNLPGMHVESQNSATGRVLIRAGMTTGTGERLPIDVVQLDSGRTRIDIAPDANKVRQAMDPEKSRAAMERIVSATSEALKAFTVQEPPRR